MPIRYYPLNRVLTNQKTNGGEFTLNGSNYFGYYYKTYNGQVFSGKDPVQGPSQILQRSSPASNTGQSSQASRSANAGSQPTFQIPVPYYPKPTSTDYKRGSIVRYFVKKRGQSGYVIEVDKSTHDSLLKSDSEYDYITYETTSLFWQISGPQHDTIQNGGKVSGIIDTNRRLTMMKDPTFPGLAAFIGEDYSKFSK
jgi:hypothetical protein